MSRRVMGCKTRTDAFLRVLDARMASNVNPTEEYLIELRNQLYHWIGRIDEELYKLYKRQAAEDEAAKDEEVSDNAA